MKNADVISYFKQWNVFTLFGHGEKVHWYRLSSLDYTSENKNSEISTSKLALVPNSKFLVFVEKDF